MSLFVLALGVVISGSNNAATVSTSPTEKLLPIYSVDRADEKICALTFDAAWDDSDTDKLIDVLEEYDASADVVSADVDNFIRQLRSIDVILD